MENWHSENLMRIKKSLLWVFSQDDGIVANHSDGVENLLVVKDKYLVVLRFMDTETLQLESQVSVPMSGIDISNPLNLLGAYSQVMMLSLVFKPHPKKLYMLGFGGGRVPMVFHHYFPDLLIESSELSEGVVQLAEICFGIVFDARMKIALKNGREHLATFPERHFDIILLDSFSGMGAHPNELSTVEFYQLCKSRMTDDAVLATNLIDNNPYQQQKIATLCAAFNFSYHYEYNGVTIIFASDVDNFSQDDFRKKAVEIAKQYQFEFPYSENTKYLSACDTETFASALLQDESIESLS